MLKCQIYHTLTNREYNTQQNRAESKRTEQNIPHHTKRAIMTGYGERMRETVKSKKCEKGKQRTHLYLFNEYLQQQFSIAAWNAKQQICVLCCAVLCCAVLCSDVHHLSSPYLPSIDTVISL